MDMQKIKENHAITFELKIIEFYKRRIFENI